MFTHRALWFASKDESVQCIKRGIAMQISPVIWAHPALTVAMHLGVWHAGTPTLHRHVSSKSSSVIAAAADSAVLQTIMVAMSGKKQRQLLQTCECS